MQPGRGVDVVSMFLLGLGQREMEITWVISIFFWLQTWSERGGSYLGNFHFSFGAKAVTTMWARWADLSPLVGDAR